MSKHRYSSALLLVFATLLLLAPGPLASAGILPADRATTWSPGVPGGVPVRTTVCATIAPLAGDATATIQAAIDACPAGQVVQLSAGTFTIDDDILYVNKGITLRGAGSSATLLQRTNGATPGTYIPGVAKPVIIVGPSRWASGGTSYNLAANGAKGAMAVQLATAPASFSPGQIVLVDELSNASWQPDPGGRGQIWAAPDWRVVYQRHNPGLGTDDPFPDAAGWFCRQDRPTSEVKEVASYDAATRTVTFTSPLHISYRATQGAQVYVFAPQDTHVKFAGVEDLKVKGGDDGQIRFEFAAYSWASRIENTAWLGEGFAINHSFRVEVRDSYVHTPVWFEPGGGSYNISLANGSSEVLIENNISTDADKVMVARCAGAGSVVGYNYMDDGHIGSNSSWVEIGLNASHMVGPHHVLFEGNWGFNFDSDKTHGNSIYHTVFRNWLTGKRTHFTDGGPKRAAGVAFYGYWMSFVGNVLGVPGGMSGWSYESTDMDTPAIWLLGWDDWDPYPSDPKVKATILREGNFDYVTNQVQWDTAAQAIPDSLYLSGKPAFFGSLTWPWVDPTGTTKVYTLPAKARYDAATSSYALTVAKVGSGSVTSVPAGISCGSTCGASYSSGTSVTLTAAPAAGYAFSSWSGACAGTGSCQVTMSAARAVTATFSASVPSLSVADIALNEGNTGSTSATFTVTLSPASSQTVTVSYATANGTATAGTDYTATSGTLTFTAGQTSKTVAVAVLGDTPVEADETLTLALSSTSGATLSRAVGTATIVNDDFPTVLISDVAVNEPSSGSTSADFMVSLSATSPQTVTVNYATANGTATAGSDYVAQAGNLSFTPGQTSKTIAVAVAGDTTVEPTETFMVNLSAPSKATLAVAQGHATIMDGSATALPKLAISDVTVFEKNSGTSIAQFTVTLSAASPSIVTVNFATANGTAAAGSDYVAQSGNLSFAAGQTTRTISITVRSDTTFEPDETFFVNLSSPAGATVADALGLGTIVQRRKR